MLPNFLVVGAQKSGTTSLHHYLIQHPDIYLPAQKETKFFLCDDSFEKGLSFYEKEFYSAYSNEKVVGEVDPDYMYFPCVLERLQTCLDMSVLKLIFILRDPVKRAYSHYLMSCRRGIETLNFEKALEKEKERIIQGNYERDHFSYVDRGYYLKQIKSFLPCVDKSRMLFLITEELEECPERELARVYRFLGVKDNIFPDNVRKHYHKAAIPYSKRLQGMLKKPQEFIRSIALTLIPREKLRSALRQKLMTLNTGNKYFVKPKKPTEKTLRKLYEIHNVELARFIGRELTMWGGSRS